jgi:PRTRC genetic system protein C
MAITIENVERKFVYSSMELDDIDASLSVDEIKNYYSNIYPELSTAYAKGPTYKDGKEVYEFMINIGTKG